MTVVNRLSEMLAETNDEILNIETPFPEFFVIMTRKAR